MKLSHLPIRLSRLKIQSSRIARQGLTLPETMITLSIFSMVIVGVMQLHLFGARQDQMVARKLGASDQSRINFQRMTGEIRSARNFAIGTGSLDSFTQIPDGEPQQGQSLMIYPTPATNTFIQYYYDSALNELKRVQSGTTNIETVASGITNTMFFRAEDYAGNLMTDRENNFVVRVLVEYFQYTYPLTEVGAGHFYDYYKMEFKATRRAHD